MTPPRKALRLRMTTAEWRSVYDAFMRSPEWAKKRASVMKRANSTCESCLARKAEQVHHLVYPTTTSGFVTITDFINQPAWQLRAVCFACHQKIHGRAA